MFNGKRVAEQRKMQGFTLKQMSIKTGYKSINGYWCIEVGLTNPTVDKVEAIARALQIPVESLLTSEPQKDGEL